MDMVVSIGKLKYALDNITTAFDIRKRIFQNEDIFLHKVIVNGLILEDSTNISKYNSHEFQGLIDPCTYKMEGNKFRCAKCRMYYNLETLRCFHEASCRKIISKCLKISLASTNNSETQDDIEQKIQKMNSTDDFTSFKLSISKIETKQEDETAENIEVFHQEMHGILNSFTLDEPIVLGSKLLSEWQEIIPKALNCISMAIFRFMFPKEKVNHILKSEKYFQNFG
jgi:hypothetical protein